MHFARVGQRTRDVVRTLSVATALFLPLIHPHTGVWIAAGRMGVIALVLGVFFWQRRRLGSTRG